MKKTSCLFILLFLLLLTQPVMASDPDFHVIPGRQYCVLNEEILTGENDVIVRNYLIFSGTIGAIDSYGGMYYGRIYDEYDIIVLPHSFSNITEAKQWLDKENPSELQLRPLTIISEKVYNQWIKEAYRHNHEYWHLAPRGLIMEEIEPIHSIIRKPFLPTELGLFKPKDSPDIRIHVNSIPIILRDDKPYLAETGEILIPLRDICNKIGFKISLRYNQDGQPIVNLTKGSRNIELSVWRDYFIINGVKVAFETNPRLSINERIMVPISLLNFMGTEIEWSLHTINVITIDT